MAGRRKVLVNLRVWNSDATTCPQFSWIGVSELRPDSSFAAFKPSVTKPRAIFGIDSI